MIWKIKFALATVLCLMLFLAASPTRAETLGTVSEGTVVLTLYYTPCSPTLTSKIDFKWRATWKDGANAAIEGCWALFPTADMVVGYFADRSVSLSPTKAVKPLKGI